MPDAEGSPRNAVRKPHIPQKGKDETVRYIAAMAGGLGDLARREKLDLAAYFLDLARLEAEQAQADRMPYARATRPPG